MIDRYCDMYLYIFIINHNGIIIDYVHPLVRVYI